MANAINIILNVKDPQNPIFIDIENNDGESISIGKTSKINNDLTKITITPTDIENIKCDGDYIRAVKNLLKNKRRYKNET